MAYEVPLDEDEENEEEGQGGSGGGQSGGQGGVVAGGGGVASQMQQQGSGDQTPGTGFQNIQRFLAANQGRGRELAGSLTAPVQGQISQSNQLANQANENFETQSLAGTAQQRQDLLGRIGLSGSGNLTDQEEGILRNLRSAQYTGPNSVQDFDEYVNARNQALQARERADLLQSAGGQKTALQSQFGDTYNQRRSRLDTALLGAEDEARNLFQQTRQSANELFPTLDQFLTSSQARADERRGQTNQAREATNVALEQARQGTLSEAQRRMAQAAQQREQMANSLRNSAAQTSWIQNQTGISSPWLTRLIDSTGANFVEVDPTQITAGSVLNNPERGQVASLERILEQDILNERDPALRQNPAEFNAQRYRDDYNQRLNNYRSALGSGSTNQASFSQYRNELDRLRSSVLANPRLVGIWDLVARNIQGARDEVNRENQIRQQAGFRPLRSGQITAFGNNFSARDLANANTWNQLSQFLDFMENDRSQMRNFRA